MNATILIVDDEADLLELLSMNLSMDDSVNDQNELWTGISYALSF